MENYVGYEAGEELVFDYSDAKDRVIWGRHFEFGDAIVVHLKDRLPSEELSRHMGKGGPWGWGSFTTKWVETIADRIEWLYDDSVLFRAPRRGPSLPGRSAAEYAWPQV